MFNKIILAGNITRDIELRYSQSGAAIAKTAIATSRKFTSNGERKEEVCFVDITFFGKSGEIANQYLRKGSKILVEGRLNFEQWTDQNGGKRSKHSVIVETMQMLGSKNDANQSNTQSDQSNTQGYQQKPQSNNGQPNSYAQENGYQQPPVYEYQNAQGQPTPPPRQALQQVPEIDINEDDIPF